MIVWHLKYCPAEDWLMELVMGKLPVRGTSSSICLPVSACSLASNNPNFSWKQHVFIRECYGPQVEIYRPDTVQFFAENIWHPARLRISQTSVGLAINCFLWDKIQAPLPSVENHLMEGVVTLRPICSHNWLTALPPPVCLYSSISLSITLAPCSAVCSDQTGPASLPDFQSILETAPLTVVCLSVSLQNTRRWRERRLNP